jgi:hypothetical protein
MVIVVDFKATEAYSSVDWPKQNTAWITCRRSRRKILQCELSLAVPLHVNKGNQHDDGNSIYWRILNTVTSKYEELPKSILSRGRGDNWRASDWMIGFIDTLCLCYYVSQTTIRHILSSFLNHLRLPPQETPSIIPQLFFSINSSSSNSSTQSAPPLNGLD